MSFRAIQSSERRTDDHERCGKRGSNHPDPESFSMPWFPVLKKIQQMSEGSFCGDY